MRKDVDILNLIKAKGPNSAVNVGNIHRRFFDLDKGGVISPKPSVWQIIEAVKDSKMVDVVDKTHVIRKVPFVDDSVSHDVIWRMEDRQPKIKPIPVHPGIKAGIFKVYTLLGLAALC